MNTAILIVSSASLVCSAGTLFIMVKVARELDENKNKVEAEFASLRAKVGRNARILKATIAQMEF